MSLGLQPWGYRNSSVPRIKRVLLAPDSLTVTLNSAPVGYDRGRRADHEVRGRETEQRRLDRPVGGRRRSGDKGRAVFSGVPPSPSPYPLRPHFNLEPRTQPPPIARQSERSLCRPKKTAGRGVHSKCGRALQSHVRAVW